MDEPAGHAPGQYPVARTIPLVTVTGDRFSSVSILGQGPDLGSTSLNYVSFLGKVPVLVDGAQGAPHLPVNVETLGCDFYCFSGHKMLGPTGTGVLWMKEPTIEPSMLGGGMVEAVTSDGCTLAQGYQRYEAGTPNIAGGIGLGAAVDYLQAIGMEKIHSYETDLTSRLIAGLTGNSKVHVFAPQKPGNRIGVVSFTVDGFHPHEVAQQLDEVVDIMVRSGHHCCQPLVESLGIPDGTVRASLALYNTRQECDMLVATLEELTR